MLAWMLYDSLVALLLGLAALAFEQAAHTMRAPVRWLWCASLAASALVPCLISSVSIQIPDAASGLLALHGGETIALRQTTSASLAPSVWLARAVGPDFGGPAADWWLLRAWLLLSVLCVAFVLGSAVHLRARSRRWQRGAMQSASVMIAEDAGPSVIGLARPRIVVPRWLLDRPAQEQALVMAHEQSHVDAGDAQLLGAALCLAVLMPWNLPLWWQMRRLRRAIEFDCDARVLHLLPDVTRYAETLIAVGARQGRGMGRMGMGLAACMSARKSLLERRIAVMIGKKTRFGWAFAVAIGFSGAVLAASSAQVSPPNASHPDARTEPALRRLVNGLIAGNPDYAAMSPQLAQLLRDQPQVQSDVAGLGPIVSVNFVKSGPNGEDMFDVSQQKGATHWVIKLDQAGVIVGAVVHAAS
jgi:Zn-dependent protease with chaperone function